MQRIELVVGLARVGERGGGVHLGVGELLGDRVDDLDDVGQQLLLLAHEIGQAGVRRMRLDEAVTAAVERGDLLLPGVVQRADAGRVRHRRGDHLGLVAPDAGHRFAQAGHLLGRGLGLVEQHRDRGDAGLRRDHAPAGLDQQRNRDEGHHQIEPGADGDIAHRKHGRLAET